MKVQRFYGAYFLQSTQTRVKCLQTKHDKCLFVNCTIKLGATIGRPFCFVQICFAGDQWSPLQDIKGFDALHPFKGEAFLFG